MKNIYIDFDATLYDTDQYDKEVENICLKHGLTSDDFKDISKELFNSHFDFDIDILIDYLINTKKLPCSIKDEYKKLNNTNYLYKDSIDFLERLSKKFNLYLLTCGVYNNQICKINSSNIKKYFKNIIITKNNKLNVDGIDYKNGIFIDNNPYELEEFKKNGFKNLIRIKYDSDKYSVIDSSLEYEYDNLLDALNCPLLKEESYE